MIEYKAFFWAAPPIMHPRSEALHMYVPTYSVVGFTSKRFPFNGGISPGGWVEPVWPWVQAIAIQGKTPQKVAKLVGILKIPPKSGKITRN